MKKLNSRGVSHLVAPVLVMLLVASVGYVVFQRIHAATPATQTSTSDTSNKHTGPYNVVTTITGSSIPPTNMPNNQWCVDISYYDATNDKYYLSDDNNKQVDVVDASTNKLLAPIGTGDFTGVAGCTSFDFSQEGPEGLVVDSHNQLWVGNGDSTVHVYNANTGAPITTINTHGTRRADEFAFDQKDDLIFVTNPDEVSDGGKPFVTAINASTHQIVSKFNVAGATNLEQPAWDSKNGLVYMSVPATDTLKGGEVAVIDPSKLASNPVVKTFPAADCGPSGLAIDGNGENLALGCDSDALIMNVNSGTIYKRISQINGVDEVWFNPGDGKYYFGSFGVPALGVVDANSKKFEQNIPSSDPGFHAAAVSSRNNEVFMPQANKGIVVLKQGN